jgi:uncharacterized membrane protein YfcA
MTFEKIDDSVLKLVIISGLTISMMIALVFQYLQPTDSTFKEVIILIAGIIGGYLGAKAQLMKPVVKEEEQAVIEEDKVA